MSWSTIDEHWNATLCPTPASLYRVDEDSHVQKYLGVANRWQQISRDIEISTLVADGERLYALSHGSLVVHRPPETWTFQIAPTPITEVVAADGKVWLLRDHEIWQLTTATSTGAKIDDDAEGASIRLAGGRLHKLDQDGEVWRYDGSAWSRVGDMRALTLYGGGGDRPYQALSDDDSLWELPPGGTEWQRIDTALDTLSVAADSDRVFKLRDDGHVLWHRGLPKSGWHDLGAVPYEPRMIVPLGARVYVLTMRSILQHDGPLV